MHRTLVVVGYLAAAAFVTWVLYTHNHVVWACIAAIVLAGGITVEERR